MHFLTTGLVDESVRGTLAAPGSLVRLAGGCCNHHRSVNTASGLQCGNDDLHNDVHDLGNQTMGELKGRGL